MSKKIALVTIHGMGTQEDNYYEDLEDRIVKEFGSTVFDSDIELSSVYYQKEFQDNQKRVWDDMQAFPLDNPLMRKFMLYSFGDAGSLEHSYHHEKTTYLDVQRCIRSALDDAYVGLGRQAKPVVVIAQSLGCQVLSNYLWDAQHNKGIFAEPGDAISAEQDSFRRLETCKYLITTGCNIPLFVAGLDKVECFARPNPSFTWHNFYDKDDILGWPLSPLSPSFRDMVDLDEDVNAGSPISSWTPFSHTKYWTDNSVLKHLFRQLRLLIGGE